MSQFSFGYHGVSFRANTCHAYSQEADRFVDLFALLSFPDCEWCVLIQLLIVELIEYSVAQVFGSLKGMFSKSRVCYERTKNGAFCVIRFNALSKRMKSSVFCHSSEPIQVFDAF